MSSTTYSVKEYDWKNLLWSHNDNVYVNGALPPNLYQGKKAHDSFVISTDQKWGYFKKNEGNKV